jgi:hypothetical protein
MPGPVTARVFERRQWIRVWTCEFANECAIRAQAVDVLLQSRLKSFEASPGHLQVLVLDSVGENVTAALFEKILLGRLMDKVDCAILIGQKRSAKANGVLDVRFIVSCHQIDKIDHVV